MDFIMPSRKFSIMSALKKHEFSMPSRCSSSTGSHGACMTPDGCMGLSLSSQNPASKSLPDNGSEDSQVRRHNSLDGSATNIEPADLDFFQGEGLFKDNLLQEINPGRPLTRRNSNRRNINDDTANSSYYSSSDAERTPPRRTQSSSRRRAGSDKDLSRSTEKSSAADAMRRGRRCGSDKDLRGLLSTDNHKESLRRSHRRHHGSDNDLQARLKNYGFSDNASRSSADDAGPAVRGVTRNRSSSGGLRRSGSSRRLSPMRNATFAPKRTLSGGTGIKDAAAAAAAAAANKPNAAVLYRTTAAAVLTAPVNNKTSAPSVACLANAKVMDLLMGADAATVEDPLAALTLKYKPLAPPPPPQTRLSSDKIKESLKAAEAAKTKNDTSDSCPTMSGVTTPTTTAASLSRCNSTGSTAAALLRKVAQQQQQQQPDTQQEDNNNKEQMTLDYHRAAASPSSMTVPVYQGTLVLPPVAPYTWKCTCGFELSLCMKFCGKCSTQQYWTCWACPFDQNPCTFGFCGMCGTQKKQNSNNSRNQN